MQEAMRGIDFSVHGTVSTSKGYYTILVDDATTMYFPIPCSEFHSGVVGGLMAEEIPFNIGNLGIYFSIASMFRAHDMFPTQVIITVGNGGKTTCVLEVFEENELGSKVSRVPFLLPDSIVLSVLCKIPVVVYGTAGTEFTFKINKGVPKETVFSSICEEIARSERLSEIGSGSDE